ncbi:hypothetical protein [Flavobacterium sp.]|uniref:hypothetical protein n=1 Tax=Flavobacterium sp. TaxID=239 RepID=UPI003753A2C7
MRLLYFLVFLFTFSVSAQIEIKINSISTTDLSLKKRKFTIKYHIKNLTNKEISFFLMPKTLIAHSASSMTLFPVYKIYQNGVFEDVDGPFYEKIYAEQEGFEAETDSEKRKKIIEDLTDKFNTEYEKTIEDYKKNGGKSTDDMWIYRNQKLIQSIVKLNPNETKEFEITTSWNKERYYKIDDKEFYLDEKDKFEIELSLFLDKSNRINSLSPEELSKIKKDENFIEGRFTSNKMEINFKE